MQTDYIDLYYQRRVDPNVPIEEVAGVILEYPDWEDFGPGIGTGAEGWINEAIEFWKAHMR